MTTEVLDRVAERVAEAGLSAAGGDLAVVAALGRQVGASPVLLAVMTGVDEPTVARERALGRLLAQVASRLDEVPQQYVPAA